MTPLFYISCSLSILFILAAFIAGLKGKEKLRICLIFFGAFSVYLGAAFLDDFVNIWDERFHALVAKNSMKNPLKPGLYANPVLGDFTVAWDATAVWLHKQPLFTWLMALSYKAFGVNYWAGRLPAALLMSLVCSFGYSVMVDLLNKRTAFLGALLMIYSYYSMSLVSGRQFIDQNDAQFVGFVSLAFFMALRFIQKQKRAWLLGSAIFTSCAILTKWLPGLYAFGFLCLVWVMGRSFKFTDLVRYFAVVVTLVLPWQIFAYKKYPNHFMHELKLNSAHFTNAVEGQVRDWDFHFLQFPNHYGFAILFLMLFGIIHSFVKRNRMAMAVSVLVVFVYGFFTLAQTRMPSFTYVAMSGVVFLSTYSLHALLALKYRIKAMRALVGLFFILTIYENFHYDELIKNFDRNGQQSYYRNGLVENKEWFKRQNLTDKDVVFNLPRRTHVELMFYTDAAAYPYWPSKKDLEKVKAAGVNLYIFKRLSEPLPDELPENAKVLNGDLKCFE